MKQFKIENYESFHDVDEIMKNIFGITCSLCGYDEISYVHKNSPKPIGTVTKEAYESDDSITDEAMNEICEKQIQAWQETDDYNAENKIPTFLCYDCFDQLKNNEINISDLDLKEKE